MTYTREISRICKSNGIADLYVFGSRSGEIAARVHGKSVTTPKNLKSDIDIGVMPADATRFKPLQRITVAIELEDLFDAPRVDLVILPEADPFLALDVIRGELLYCDNPDRQARHELYVLRRAGDLMHFKKRRIQMILEEGAR
jgi:predicted nucleotidyltransferase